LFFAIRLFPSVVPSLKTKAVEAGLHESNYLLNKRFVSIVG
jgi:hypothetical protein